jgi:hypothetical protein
VTGEVKLAGEGNGRSEIDSVADGNIERLQRKEIKDPWKTPQLLKSPSTLHSEIERDKKLAI